MCNINFLDFNPANRLILCTGGWAGLVEAVPVVSVGNSDAVTWCFEVGDGRVQFSFSERLLYGLRDSLGSS